MSTLKEEFGRRVRQKRKEAGLSQEQLAEKANLSANYIGRIERGDKWVSPDVLDRLSRVLRVQVVEFFKFEDPKRATEINAFESEMSQINRVLKGHPIEDISFVREYIEKLFKKYRRK